MLIGGEWRQAAAHEEIEVVNPATEDVVATVPAASSALALAGSSDSWNRTPRPGAPG